MGDRPIDLSPTERLPDCEAGGATGPKIPTESPLKLAILFPCDP